MKTSAKTGCLRDDGKVSRVLTIFPVVVDVSDVLVETDVEFPSARQLVLYGANSSPDVELAYRRIVW